MKNTKIEKPKNDVIYIRVSSKEQIENFSLDNQERFCKEFSSRAGHLVIAVFREEGESAKTKDRTRFLEMLNFCEKNKKKISRVVIYKVDRFFRNTGEHLAFRGFLKKMDISLVSVTEAFDDTPSGKLQETMLAAFAEFDNNVRAQRTKEGMKARAEQGLWPSSAPWGYMNTKDKTGDKIIIPHPERGAIVLMIFEKYKTGKYTFQEIAKMANKMGMKSRHGLKISKQLVAKIIKNPIYKGRVVIPKFEVDVIGQHEAIVSEELWNEVNNKKRGIPKQKLPRNKDNQEYPMRGIKCAYCGHNMTGGKTKGKTKYYDYYSCYNANCPNRKAIPKDSLENDFTNFLTELVPDNDYFDVLKEAIRIAHKEEIRSITSTERKVNSRIIEVKSRKDKLLDLMVDGKIPPDEYLLAVEKCKLEIIELEKELSELHSPELEVDNVIDTGIEFLKTLPETWKDLDVKDLRVLRNLLFMENLTYHYPTIKTPKLCCIYNIKEEFLDTKYHQVTSGRIELPLTD